MPADRPRRNRVTPLSEIVAIPLRGAWLGNRGILHRGTEIVRSSAGMAWIICELQHKDWRLPQWAPHHYTILFFHDEAVALAAGHRPCALCRRPAYRSFGQAIATASGLERPPAKELDRTLHSERLVPGTHRRRLHRQTWRSLPDGSFVLVDNQPAMVLGDAVVPWTTLGYRSAMRRPAGGEVSVITPPTSVSALRAGYPLQINTAASDLALSAG